MTDSTSTDLSRTRWAEKHVEGFISPTLVSEFVFRSPQVMDGTLQREVADLLIVRGTQGLLVSQKCQGDPMARNGDKVVSWARKQAVKAASQLKGALRRIGDPGEIWCEHPRRGRVSFQGLPPISHAIATLEVFQQVDLQESVPLESGGLPVSYFSVSDFLNLSLQLRTVPEFVRYLDERRSLPASELRAIGGEKLIFEYYLLHDGSLLGYTSRATAADVMDARADELRSVVSATRERNEDSRRLEHVCHELSGRHKDYDVELSEDVLKHFEPTNERGAYLRMQDVLAGLHLAERAALGSAFERAHQERKAMGGKGFAVAAALLDGHPDWVFVFGSLGTSGTFTRATLLSMFPRLANDAMFHYGRTKCLVIVDRDGLSYEVAIGELKGPPPEKYESKIFGPLKMTPTELHFRS
jgi:hypothetical protein